MVDAAINLFYEKGYSATSLQDVADAVGVLKGSLYHYISSKEDLLFRILQESHEQAREIMGSLADEGADPFAKLRLYLERMYMWYLSHIERVSLYFNQQQYLTGTNKTEMQALSREFERFLRKLVTNAKEAGAFHDDLDIKLGTFFVLGALNSIPMWYKPSGPYSPKRIASEFADMSLSSLKAHREVRSASGTTRRTSRSRKPSGQ